MNKPNENSKNNFKTAFSQLVNGTTGDVPQGEFAPSSIRPDFDRKPEPSYDPYFSAPVSKPVGKTIIGEDTVIDGNIQTQNDLEIAGTINGNISCAGHVKLSGNVQGDLKATSIDIFGGTLKGENLAVDKLVTIGTSSVVQSQITADSIEISGNVLGNITVTSDVSLKETSSVIGNITSKYISIQKGAVLRGNLTIENGPNGSVSQN